MNHGTKPPKDHYTSYRCTFEFFFIKYAFRYILETRLNTCIIPLFNIAPIPLAIHDDGVFLGHGNPLAASQ